MARKKRRKKLFESLTVTDAGAKGKAVAKAPDGRVVFIDNAVPGDVADVQTYKKRKSYYQGKATDFDTLSEKRTTPVCRHFEHCGGCKWQNMAYEYQLEYKQKEVENNLRRLGHLDLPEINPIRGCETIYFYRNKMEFSFSDNRWLTPTEIESGQDFDEDEKKALGFHIAGMWDKILNIEKCHLQKDPSNAVRNSVREFAIENGLSFFNLRDQKGLLRNLMIRTSSTGDLMVLIQFYHEDKEKRELLLNHLADRFPEITSLQYIINAKPNDSIYDQEVICYKGKDHITEEMEGLQFKIGAKSFYQTNSQQAYELYKIIREFAQIREENTVYDLYTGIGSIAQFIAGQARKIIGVEAVPEAIGSAKANAKANGIENTEFFAGDMRKVLTQDFIDKHGQPDVIITDPPRPGMHKDVIGQLLKVKAQRIIYVSCNSATQARDLSLLEEAYTITKVQPVDMFPQTHHIENVVCLEKRL